MVYSSSYLFGDTGLSLTPDVNLFISGLFLEPTSPLIVMTVILLAVGSVTVVIKSLIGCLSCQF